MSTTPPGPTMTVDPGAAESEIRLRAILHTAVDAIVTIKTSGEIESANPAAERMFGYTRGELLGRNVSILMPPPWREEHDRHIARYLHTGEARIIGIGREIEAQRKDGSIFPVDLAVSEVRLPRRRLFTGIIRDLTERRKMEEQARLRLEGAAHTARLLELGEMCSGIVHEVNQPLAAIVSFADGCLRMVHSGRAEPALIEDTLSRIAKQGARAGEILSRLRSLVRKEESRRETIDLGEAIGEVLLLVDHERRRRSVRVEIECEPWVPVVSVDRVHVEQILLNLLRNAFHAVENAEDRRVWVQVMGTSPGMGHEACMGVRSGVRSSGREDREGATIRQSSRPPPADPSGRPMISMREITHRHADRGGTVRSHANVRLVVEDSGPGIAPELRERIFEPFYTTRPNGLGVGLAISRSLAERHGGSLRAEMNGTGGGARFVLELPCATKDM